MPRSVSECPARATAHRKRASNLARAGSAVLNCAPYRARRASSLSSARKGQERPNIRAAMEHAPKPFGLARILQFPQVPVETAVGHRISAGTKPRANGGAIGVHSASRELQLRVDFARSPNRRRMSGICAKRPFCSAHLNCPLPPTILESASPAWRWFSKTPRWPVLAERGWGARLGCADNHAKAPGLFAVQMPHRDTQPYGLQPIYAASCASR